MKHRLYLWLAKKLYFPIARYFRFFASLVLKRWHPQIVVVMGSAGKSNAHNLFHQIITKKYTCRKSRKANSAFAIPLDVLDIHITNYSVEEWFWQALKVPFYSVFRCLFTFKEQYYVVELDVDRIGEMAFFASFIKPEYVFWVSSYATHTANFDKLVKLGKYQNPASAVAAEFAKMFGTSKKLVGLVNADSKFITESLRGYRFNRYDLKQRQGNYSFGSWQIFRKRTTFKLKMDKEKPEIELPFIAPKNFGYTLLAGYILAKLLKVSDRDFNEALSTYQFNPGICSILEGLNGTKIIDSSYNSSFYATKSLMEVLDEYPGKRKIAVLGDMRELGMESEKQHQNLAKEILRLKFDQVVLVGPEMLQHAYPILQKKYEETALHHFQNTYQAGLFIKERLLRPGDVVLLKASQNTLHFEIIAELLLADPQDTARLCRREPVWEKKRLQIKDEFYKLL